MERKLDQRQIAKGPWTLVTKHSNRKDPFKNERTNDFDQKPSVNMVALSKLGFTFILVAHQSKSFET